MNPPKIDVHHHNLPDFYRQAVVQAGDVSGAPAPPATIEDSLQLMDGLNIGTAIISLSAPGAEIAPTTEAPRNLARQYNDYAYQFRTANPTRLGYFGALPSLNDVEGCIAEIRYMFDEQKPAADGVTLFTSYGEKYLGHEDFKPIWRELHNRHAVVFVHPTHTPSGTWASPQLQQPILDYTHETTRTAADLILSGRKAAVANCKIILSHAGGTLPYLAERLEHLSTRLFETSETPTGSEVIELAKSFYFDTALSSGENVLDLLLKWAPEGHVLFGSDFPFAPDETIEYFTRSLEAYKVDDGKRAGVFREAALRLFPRLAM